jgi:hypothetical protein
MSVDLRTEINDCDATTGFTGDGPVAVDNTTGFVYEGTNAITTQHTNTDEHIYTTEDSVNGGTFSVDWSDVTLYLIVKDNLVQTAANGGVQFVIGDGTDRVGYGVGGNDDPGMPLDVFWNTYKLDVTERANAPYNNVYAGVLANLTVTAITQVGLGTVHLAKAQGNVDNIKLDRITYVANGSYALRINGGTSGTPETTADVEADSISSGWGMVSEPLDGVYTFFAPTEWGEPAANADSYFSASNEAWFWVGGVVGATHFPFRVVGNATDTNSFVLDTVAITNLGTRAQFDMSSTNIDTLNLDAVTFTDLGAITFPPAAVGRYCDDSTFVNCDQCYLDTLAMDNATFDGTTDATGAILIDTNGQTANQTGFTFVSDGAGHAIYITQAGTYSLVGWTYSGYGGTPGSNTTPNSGSTDAVVYNNSGGAVVLNISGGGDSPSVRNGASATTTVNNNVNITLTGMRDNTEVRVYDQSSPPVELAGIENATNGTANNRSFSFSLSASTLVDIAIFNVNFIVPPNNRIEDYTIPSSDTSIPITQVPDRNYSNP